VLENQTTPKSKQKRGNRQTRQNKVSDSILLKGHERLALISTGGAGAIALVVNQFSPANLGDRPAQVAPAFLRYRFRRLRTVFKCSMGTNSTGLIAMGIADDTDVTATPNPTAAQIMSMRKAVEFQAGKNASLTWTPVDKTKWYYVDAENSNNDARFTIPATLFLISDQTITAPPGTSWNASPVGVIDVYYEIEYSGATTIAV
jgi:hypothetical protein